MSRSAVAVIVGVFGALGLAGVGSAANRVDCHEDGLPALSLYPDSEVVYGQTAQDAASLQFAQPTKFAGSFMQPAGDGSFTTVALDGAIAASLPGMMTERLGEIAVISDVTTAFQANLSAGTHLILEFSRPEAALTNFAATFTVWAVFDDGSRAMVCKNTDDNGVTTCIDSLHTVDCTTL